jgi:hypothetical protein
MKPASRLELDVPQGTLSISYRLRGSGTEWKRFAIEVRPDETACVVLEP